MKKILTIIAVFILLWMLFSGCVSMHSCPTYSYKYRDLQTGDTLTGADWIPYLPRDTVVFYPECRQVVIITTQIGNTILK